MKPNKTLLLPRSIIVLFFILLGMSGAVTVQSCKNTNVIMQDTLAAFKYREVFLPEGMGEQAAKKGLNSIDEDWGIWGHNLANVLPEKHSNSIYAKINGNTFKKQYCFSSHNLYEYIEDYISSKYDDDEQIRFAIIPNDNDVVCICEKCVEAGNTKEDASPAVEKLVRKLANRFPNHIFYTSDYKTTQKYPSESMPANTGVLMSAINFPLRTTESKEETAFTERIKNWKAATPRIFVWDYINNFDDYFTPFPVLGAMQRRLNVYKDNKVTAVFLNGSGPDISAFSRLHTDVLAALTENPDTDWRQLLREKAIEYYPVSGELIADFMLFQEDLVSRNGVTLPLYEGVEKVRKSYLPEEEFVKFHDTLITLYPKTDGNEKKEIEILLGELALTRMELNRINGNPLASEPYKAALHRLMEQGYYSYNEAGWTIEDYLKDYDYLTKHYEETATANKLKGMEIKAVTPLDPDYNNTSILTDGVLGMPSNYHNGHLIMSPERAMTLMVPKVEGAKKLKVWLSYNPGYKIHLPQSVALKAEGMKKMEVEPEYPNDLSGHAPIEFDLPGDFHGPLYLILTKDPETRSMAIEEIELQ